MNDTSSIGSRIRQQRQAQNLKLVQLAKRCDISPSFLSQIERDQANPSVATLYSIANALGVSSASFFSDSPNGEAQAASPERATATVVRAGQRKVIAYPGSGIRNELLSPDMQGELQLMWIVMPPGTESGEPPFFHEGEECGIILQGEIETWVGEDRFILGPGDSISHKSTIPHRCKNIGDTEVIMVVAKKTP